MVMDIPQQPMKNRWPALRRGKAGAAASGAGQAENTRTVTVCYNSLQRAARHPADRNPGKAADPLQTLGQQKKGLNRPD